MRFEREAARPILNPAIGDITKHLRQLRTSGPSTYASVTADTGTYLQVAGSPAGMLLEKHEGVGGKQFRASQLVPVVPFPDGTELAFTGGRIRMLAAEWFTLKQVVEVFGAFLKGDAEPSFVRWRELSLVAIPSRAKR